MSARSEYYRQQDERMARRNKLEHGHSMTCVALLERNMPAAERAVLEARKAFIEGELADLGYPIEECAR